ncbi:MAG: NAD-dependent deacylase [Acidobacteriaceae bacterium]|nr:NAD-dependent deacylase [Acidobacteriaceae bacterium]
MDQRILEGARDALRSARSVAVLTGAGISAESGIPTFRGAAGLWKQFRPEELATAEAFAGQPELVWEWYDWRRSLIARAEPNAGHYALVELERRVSKFTLITQNVDGLHRRAGSKHVLEIHGTIWNLRCTRCRREWTEMRVPLPLQRCECGGIARPAVVWFGETLPARVWEEAQGAVKSCDVFLVVGTSAVVYPAAGLVPLARSAGARIVEVNIEPTAYSDAVAYALNGPAGEVLPQIC